MSLEPSRPGKCPSTTSTLQLLAGPWILLFVQACALSPGTPRLPPAMDHHSHARPAEVQVTHASLDLGIDFKAKRLSGQVELRLLRRDRDADLTLDSKELDIQAVTGADGSMRGFALGPSDPLLGSALTIELAPGDDRVTVRYRTRPGAAALQWLEPAQTSGDKPFLYTQGQAILTRTWVPLQDSPGVRITFDARIKAPEGLEVVMAAEMLGRDSKGAHLFRMRQPIPPYLLALACGELRFAELSPRCGVWAEASVVDGAAKELEDLPAMLATAERLFGPYRWERYDVLVLPAAFPFGGMENPRLTFATPTILAGDKSLVSLIAHELAHSWSGNLVTNATWSDFWLNEGFTVYLEQRIMEAIYGPERAAMEILIGMQGLEEELPRLEPYLRVLHPDLRGKDPDKNMTAVPYDKGAAFLRTLEHHFGRDRFDRFLAGYFDAHAFQSITTGEFLAWLRDQLLDRDEKLAAELHIDEWVHASELPADAHRPNSAAFEAVDEARTAWLGGKPAAELGAGGWVTQQWLHFLQGMSERLDAAGMARLDRAFAFTSSHNAEILAAWLKLAIRHGYTAADRRLEEFLLAVGRRKFLEPLYKELAKTEAGMRRARAIYSQARPRYHTISARTIDEVLGLSR